MTQSELFAILGVWQTRLGLGHWNIYPNWVDPPELGDEGKPAEASIAVHPDYDQASVRFNAERYPDWDERHANITIVHELLHCYERGVRNCNTDVGSVMNDKLYDLHWRRYEHEVEGWIDRLAIVLVDLVGVA